jgi:hypothetical protein
VKALGRVKNALKSFLRWAFPSPVTLEEVLELCSDMNRGEQRDFWLTEDPPYPQTQNLTMRLCEKYKGVFIAERNGKHLRINRFR